MKLEELFKDKWALIQRFGDEYAVLGRTGERIIYDFKKEEIIKKYSVVNYLKTKDL